MKPGAVQNVFPSATWLIVGAKLVVVSVLVNGRGGVAPASGAQSTEARAASATVAAITLH
jgi:hypothetical protein